MFFFFFFLEIGFTARVLILDYLCLNNVRSPFLLPPCLISYPKICKCFSHRSKNFFPLSQFVSETYEENELASEIGSLEPV